MTQTVIEKVRYEGIRDATLEDESRGQNLEGCAFETRAAAYSLNSEIVPARRARSATAGQRARRHAPRSSEPISRALPSHGRAPGAQRDPALP